MLAILSFSYAVYRLIRVSVSNYHPMYVVSNSIIVSLGEFSGLSKVCYLFLTCFLSNLMQLNLSHP